VDHLFVIWIRTFVLGELCDFSVVLVFNKGMGVLGKGCGERGEQ